MIHGHTQEQAVIIRSPAALQQGSLQSLKDDAACYLR